MDSQQLGLLTQAINRCTAVVLSGGGLAGKVPYTGAISAVDLGSQTLTTTGKISTGTGLSGNALVQFTSMKGTGRVDIGEYTTGRGAIWINQSTTQSTSNFSLSGDSAGNTTFLNGASGVSILINASIYVSFASTGLTLGGGQPSYNISCNSTNGTKIGVATSEKISLWNATPDIQPTTAIAAAAFVTNTSLIANDTATFGGYTIGQVVAALKRVGVLA